MLLNNLRMVCYKKMLQLDDLVYSFPDIDNPYFQTLISEREEFKEIEPEQTEKITTGVSWKHQQIIQRYFVEYDKLLLFHATGSGKSCTTMAPAFFLLRSLFSSLKDFLYDYILLQKTYIENIIIVVKGKDLKLEFLNEIVTKCTNIHEEIPHYNSLNYHERFYEFKKSKYGKYFKFYTQYEFVKNIYTSTNINNDVIERNIRQYDKSLIIIDEVHTIFSRSKIKKSQEQEVDVIKYDQYHKILHDVKYSKIILATGTPMTNTTNEIKFILNLLLPLNKQMPEKFDTDNASIDDFFPYMNGLISFIRREEEKNVVIEIMGNVIPYNNNSFYKIFKVKAAKFQTEILYDISKYKDKESFKRNSIDASNFVFPDGSYGKNGFKKYIIKENTDIYSPTQEFREMLKNIENIKKFSIKFYTIIMLNKELKGNCFCYSISKTGSGAILLGICLENQGFSRYKEKRNVFAGIDGKIDLNKKLRYALITSDTPQERINSIKQVFNSKENIDGEYIKIIIGTPKTQMGINFKNVVLYINLSPEWTESGNYQAMSRAIRAKSHQDLIARDGSVYVKIFNLATYIDSKDNKLAKELSTDKYIYDLVIKKDLNIKRIERIMQRLAIDCHLLRKRNIQSSLIDFSKECNYDTCDYSCYVEKSEKTDYTSYINLYYSDAMILISEYLYQSFNSNVKQITFDDIHRKFPRYDKKLIEKIIIFFTNKEFINNFGIPVTIKHTKNAITIKETQYDSLIISNTKQIKQLNEDYITDVNKFETRAEIKNYLKDIIDKPGRLENLVENITIKRDNTDNEKIVLDILKNFVFKTVKMTNTIDSLKVVKKKKSGRKTEEEKKTYASFILMKENEQEQIYVHFINVLQKLEGYNARNPMQNPKKIRIMDKQKWRDCTQEEILVYGFIFREKYLAEFNKFKDNKYFGIKFAIRDTLKIVSRTDSFSIGIKCDVWGTKEQIAEILNYLKVDIKKLRVKDMCNQILTTFSEKGLLMRF